MKNSAWTSAMKQMSHSAQRRVMAADCSAALPVKQFLIEPFDVSDQSIQAVARENCSTAAFAEVPAFLGIFQQRCDMRRERRGIVKGGEQADRVQHIADATDIGADARHAGRKAL